MLCRLLVKSLLCLFTKCENSNNFHQSFLIIYLLKSCYRTRENIWLCLNIFIATFESLTRNLFKIFKFLVCFLKLLFLLPDEKKGVDRSSTVIARDTNEGTALKWVKRVWMQNRMILLYGNPCHMFTFFDLKVIDCIIDENIKSCSNQEFNWSQNELVWVAPGMNSLGPFTCM